MAAAILIDIGAGHLNAGHRRCNAARSPAASVRLRGILKDTRFTAKGTSARAPRTARTLEDTLGSHEHQVGVLELGPFASRDLAGPC